MRVVAVLLLLLVVVVAPDDAAAGDDGPRRRGLLPVPSGDVALNSTAGLARLANASHPAAFHHIATHLETQRNQAFCSAATSVTILNALAGAGVDAPVDGFYAPYAYYTQRALFENACVRRAKTHVYRVNMSPKFLARGGATLEEWALYLSCFVGQAGVARHHADANENDANAFRVVVKATLADAPNAFIGVNFRRVEIGEAGGGHMSPIGAYDDAADAILVMDVSRYKYPPVWTPLRALHDAMLAVDEASGKSRGWVVVRRGAGETRVRDLAVPGPETWPSASDRAEKRVACLDAVDDEYDWDAVMRCERVPIAPHPSDDDDVDRALIAAFAVIFAFFAGGGAVAFAAWVREKMRSEGKFRGHVVLEDVDFDDDL